MKKIKKSRKYQRHLRARARYSAKRKSQKWKNRKKSKKLTGQQINQQRKKVKKQARKPRLRLPAPNNFSLIDNTNEVLKYFEEAEKILRKGNNLILDISDVDKLTPATIALMIASINDVDFTYNSHIIGNEPKKKQLKKLFRESGFYDHVKTRRAFANNKNQNNILHKEVNHKVVPKIAKAAFLTGVNYVFGKKIFFEPLYEILVECMVNTNNHADLRTKGKCNWWLFVCNEPKEKNTSYSFVDLGVGIFESVVVQSYLKRIAKSTPFYKNINLVDDLLSGKLQSRIDIDKEIRGKGIPQIVEHSKLKHFKSFYIIANDVKINLKTKERIQLKYPLRGTFLYWELIK